MAELSKWVIPESMQDEYISNLTKMLSGLRDLMGINQSDIAKMIGFISIFRLEQIQFIGYRGSYFHNLSKGIILFT